MAAEEPHYETLCTVIQGDDPGWQAFSQRTLHNIPLRIITLGGLHGDVPEEELDLFEFPARDVTVSGACPPRFLLSASIRQFGS